MKKYGVEIIPRPAIKATKRLDLNGKMGEEMIKSLTKLILIRHQKAFKRLSEMWVSKTFHTWNLDKKSFLIVIFHIKTALLYKDLKVNTYPSN